MPPAQVALPTASFDYELPPDRIAQEPLAQRDASRLLEVGAAGELADQCFADLASLLRPGDICVVNDTRVRAARLRARRDGGGAAELLVLRRRDDAQADYTCLVRPARRLQPGARLRIGEELRAEIMGLDGGHDGARTVRFSVPDGDVEGAIEREGEAPLPPYVHTRLEDGSRYQTVYADGAGESAAAPTAGLHFTPQSIEGLRKRGVGWASVRLQVGMGTFLPIRADDVSAHALHHERFRLDDGAAQAITRARERGGRVLAVGTTVVRVLESRTDADGRLHAGEGMTGLFIKPGHRFAAVDGLLTNFHMPRSSLLVLLAAFIGMERWRGAYEHALARGYRFLSFGDCMLCWAPTTT